MSQSTATALSASHLLTAGMVSADPDETLTAQVVEHRGADYFIWASDYAHLDASFGVVREMQERLAPLPIASPLRPSSLVSSRSAS